MVRQRVISVGTELPGPRSRAILERKRAVVAEALSLYLPIVVAEARGAVVTATPSPRHSDAESAPSP